ncbi:Cof-type HAD-IIB family hydrolase [Ilyobacter polytropus]|uniref:Cof-like hydrolase n=1 Tax=Ilyobacter polytropus (strain ATCC 51220 / DSM 2926 / LMG 16218 / CuHBu1) TaxID=572544 RepID=E3HD69_ILYPC|nr:Cof-type HAD-IIB family hydrolase [Ilyobacter polytropus]ADO84545.1 Cof-like hydrolase [Ilyobacter polytropus DSM 2926]
MNRYKAVICDLDGTLLNSEHTISAYTKKVIEKIKSLGIKFFIATGRHHRDALAFKNILGLDSFLITSNGAKIHDENDKEIFSSNIPKEMVKKIIDFPVDEEIHRGIYKDEFWFLEEHIEGLDVFHKESGFSSIIKPFDELKNEDVTKFIFISADSDKINELEKIIKLKFNDLLNITLSFENCLEIVQKGVSKGFAIEEILKKENISPVEALAFGDGLNDLDMLQTVGKGFLMGNSHKKLIQSLPNHEIIDTNNNDGVAKYLEKIFL